MSSIYKFQSVGNVEVFYREAGIPEAPVILLLHGFPSASHMFRELTPLLADRYHVIAPDLPGFGNTEAPPRGEFDYTFDNLATLIKGFLAEAHSGTSDAEPALGVRAIGLTFP